jgi:PPOX class probable F420-dependent enzyme
MSTEFPQTHIDLLQQPNTAVLTTVGDDGRPYSTAIWFVLDDDGLLKTSAVMSLKKYRNIVKRPVCSLFVMDPKTIWRWIQISADVEVIPDPDKALLPKVSAKYGVNAGGIMPTAERSIAVFHARHVVAFAHGRAPK